MFNKKISSELAIGALVVFTIAVGIVFSWQDKKESPKDSRLTNELPKQEMCTQEAKLCEDGSYVGRTGPNCEFAKCPGE